MKVYNDHGNPVVVFEHYPFSWFHQRYFLSIELYYTGTEDFLKKIVVTGRASVPEQLMRQGDSLISEEFRKIIEYLEKHPELCQVLQEIPTPEGGREEYSLEDLRAFNQVSGPIHLGAAPMKGRSMRDILTLEWNAEKEEL